MGLSGMGMTVPTIGFDAARYVAVDVSSSSNGAAGGGGGETDDDMVNADEYKSRLGHSHKRRGERERDAPL